MTPKLSRPWAIALIALAVLLIAGLITWFFLMGWTLAAWIVLGLIIALVVGLFAAFGPPLIRWYKFQKSFKKYEKQFQQLPSLMMAGRTPQALMLFEELMKDAPESAYFYYLRAMFTERAGKLPEALAAVNKAITLSRSDPLLPAILQEYSTQMPGQPATVEEFRRQLDELKASLEPRVNAVRQRKAQAAVKRKKKSRE
jgi:tetratricopeptide (TPR) repeat protein